MTTFAALMCHAPIVVPAVGKDEAHRCAHTTRAMREVAARVVRSTPDRLVLLSPHSPRRRGAWSAWAGPWHRGHLGTFRAPDIAVELPDAPEVQKALDLPLIPAGPLDHGAMVPLAFLWAAGWRGPTAILALPLEEGGTDALGEALRLLEGRTAIIASGDMSHRLVQGAPAGFHPHARDFDRAFIDALEEGDWESIADLPWRDEAAEDAVTSTRAAQAAVQIPRHDEVLSYEGPWGVGYAEAILHDPDPALYAVARRAVRAHLQGRSPDRRPAGRPARPVFVTLRTQTPSGEDDLRGCVGHLEVDPSDDLFDVIAEVAVSAATRDPRFDPVDRREVDDLTFEVSVLSDAFPLTDETAHDPKKRGLIVASGRRRGLLLPDIEDVDTLEEQEQLCRRKAGLSAREPATRTWFTVDKEAQPR